MSLHPIALTLHQTTKISSELYALMQEVLPASLEGSETAVLNMRADNFNAPTMASCRVLGLQAEDDMPSVPFRLHGTWLRKFQGAEFRDFTALAFRVSTEIDGIFKSAPIHPERAHFYFLKHGIIIIDDKILVAGLTPEFYAEQFQKRAALLVPAQSSHARLSFMNEARKLLQWQVDMNVKQAQIEIAA